MHMYMYMNICFYIHLSIYLSIYDLCLFRRVPHLRVVVLQEEED